MSVTRNIVTSQSGAKKTYWRVRFRDTDGVLHSKSFRSRKEAEKFDSSASALIATTRRAKALGRPEEEIFLESRETYNKDISTAEFGDVKSFVDSKSESISDISEAFLKASRIGRDGRVPLRPSTLRSYEHKIGLICRYIGHIPYKNVRRKNITDLRDGLLTEGMSRKTVLNTIVTLRTIFNWLIEEGRMTSNPASGIKVQMPDHSKNGEVISDEIYTDEEVKLLFKAAGKTVSEIRDLAIFAFAFFAGLRIGEILGLEWKNLDFEKNVVTVLQSAEEQTGELAPTKTRRGRRALPLVPPLLRFILPWQEVHPTKEGRIFTTKNQTPVTARNALRSLYQWQKKVGFRRRLHFHHARHWFASKLIEARYDLTRLTSMMGHADEAFTLRVYGHLLNIAERQEKDSIDMANAFNSF